MNPTHAFTIGSMVRMFSRESLTNSRPHVCGIFIFRPVAKSNQSHHLRRIVFAFGQCESSQFSILVGRFQFMSDQKPDQKKLRWKIRWRIILKVNWKVRWKVRWKVEWKVRSNVKSKAKSGFIAIDSLFYLATKNEGYVLHHRCCHQIDHASFVFKVPRFISNGATVLCEGDMDDVII